MAVTDERLKKAIDGIADKKVAAAFKGEYDWHNLGISFVRDHADTFKKLLPTLYDEMAARYADTNGYIYESRAFFVGYLCVELGIVDFCDVRSIKNIVGAKIQLHELGVGAFANNYMCINALAFNKGLKSGAFTADDLIEFVKQEPEYSAFLMPLMASADEPSLWRALNDYVLTARQEDNLRIYALNAMLNTRNPAALEYFAGEIERNNYYRLKAMNEIPSFMGSCNVFLPPKEIVAIVLDAKDARLDKFVDCSFKRGYYFIKALCRLRPEKVNEYVETLMKRGGTRARQAVMYALPQADICRTYARVVFAADSTFTLEELAFFDNKIIVELLDESRLPVVFELLYTALMSMERVTYHYKTDDDVTFARDIFKSNIVGILADIAARSNSREYAARLDALYGGLKEEAQAAYLSHIGKLTALDARQCAIRFLKTDEYWSKTFYEDKKIKLTYAEAVGVSDYLKSKNESVKRRIIKEFLKSPDIGKITEYLLAAKEDYKVAAGRELSDSAGRVVESKLDKKTERYAWRKESVHRVDAPDDELNALATRKVEGEKLSPLAFSRLKSFMDGLSAFIDANKDYEYTPNYGDGAVTFGSDFSVVKGGYEARGFERYPLGAELREYFRGALTDAERAALALTILCYNDFDAAAYEALFGKNADAKKIFALFDGYDKDYHSVTAYSIVCRTLSIIIEELISHDGKMRAAHMLANDAAVRLMTDDAHKSKKSWCLNFHVPAFANYAVKNATERDLPVLARLVCKWLGKKYDDSFSDELYAELYEQGVFSARVMRYIALKDKLYFRVMFDKTAAERYIMRADYKYPKFRRFVLDFIQDGLNAEFARGSLETPYSSIIGSTGCFFGVENYMRAIVALRGLTWVRSPFGSEKNSVLSAVLKSACKTDGDSYERFSTLVEKYKITDDELLRATLFNPEYVDFTGEYLRIPHLKFAVYWFAAHLNETLYADEQELKAERLKEFSDISLTDFKDGAFDGRWYAEMTAKVPEVWLNRIYDNAKYVTVGGLHKRAQRFFDAVGGRIDKAECLDKIHSTRNKDYCLIYSLIPVKDKADLRERYMLLNDFLQSGKQFGAQRQLSERRTVDIALDNLARAAGYADSSIFIFEMEAETPSDIFKPYAVGDITVEPYIDDKRFKIAYTVARAGKPLSAIPSKYGKDKTVLALRDEINKLNKKLKRIIRSFEDAMTTRVPFTAEQLASMRRERIIAAVLDKLLLLADGALATFDGDAIVRFDGARVTAEQIYVAHPAELKRRGLLQDAIAYVAKNNVKQPFKQALREIYVKSEQEERQDEVLRFKGFNVDLRKCVAALKGRGWGVSEDVGLRKVYYRADTVAAIFREFDLPYSFDFDNVNRELYGIFFLRRNSGEIMPLSEVDDVTFSETLRDTDLMITVSSNVVYDLELAMSTVEIRREILRSIVDILGLENVSFLKDNIKVAGYYGTYVINIRTGLVFKEGKGNLLLDTVYSVDKPLLLDFVDEDPMTADVISKAIVLSADKDIRDSTLLSEIKA